VKPEYVVYTLSRGNRWGFPKPAVVARYEALGIRQLRSDRDGAITVTSKLDGLTVKAIRVPLKRIWRRW
jgi:competence protein ComEC